MLVYITLIFVVPWQETVDSLQNGMLAIDVREMRGDAWEIGRTTQNNVVGIFLDLPSRVPHGKYQRGESWGVRRWKSGKHTRYPGSGYMAVA
jgi:hypothetical protein